MVRQQGQEVPAGLGGRTGLDARAERAVAGPGRPRPGPRPRTGRIWNNATFTVPTALLVELAHEGRVSVSGSGKKARASVRDPAPLGDPELDGALMVVGSGAVGQKVTRLVGAVPKTHHLVRRLVSEGVLLEESHRWEAGRRRVGVRVRATHFRVHLGE